jgi:hypothetical protein
MSASFPFCICLLHIIILISYSNVITSAVDKLLAIAYEMTMTEDSFEPYVFMYDMKFSFLEWRESRNFLEKKIKLQCF